MKNSQIIDPKAGKDRGFDILGLINDGTLPDYLWDEWWQRKGRNPAMMKIATGVERCLIRNSLWVALLPALAAIGYLYLSKPTTGNTLLAGLLVPTLIFCLILIVGSFGCYILVSKLVNYVSKVNDFEWAIAQLLLIAPMSKEAFPATMDDLKMLYDALLIDMEKVAAEYAQKQRLKCIGRVAERQVYSIYLGAAGFGFISDAKKDQGAYAAKARVQKNYRVLDVTNWIRRNEDWFPRFVEAGD